MIAHGPESLFLEIILNVAGSEDFLVFIIDEVCFEWNIVAAITIIFMYEYHQRTIGSEIVKCIIIITVVV